LQLPGPRRKPAWIAVGLAVALLDAAARDLQTHHVASVAFISLAESSVLTMVERVLLPGACSCAARAIPQR